MFSHLQDFEESSAYLYLELALEGLLQYGSLRKIGIGRDPELELNPSLSDVQSLEV